MTVEEITPKAPGPKDTIRLQGRVANTSPERLDGLQIRLRYSARAMVTRTQLDRYVAGRLPWGTAEITSTTKRLPALKPRASTRWRMSVPTSDLGLGGFGVYPLAIEVLDARYQRVEMIRTLLPYVPEGPGRPQPTTVAWLWPLVDRPHRVTDSTFFDDEFGSRLASDGRLRRLVDVAAQARARDGESALALTYAIDPQLLEDARAMSEGYRVRQDEEVQEREPSEAAADWLSDVRTLTTDATTLAVPYADPDMAALTHAGLDDNLTLAVTRGERLAEEILGRDVTRDITWPPGGVLDQDTLDNLVVAGTRSVILADTALPPAQALTYTPDAVATVPTIGGTVRVLVADSTLSRILGRNTWTPGAAVLAEQRFLAETALITAERPNQRRTLLIAPPRRWNPHPDFAASLLADAAQVPWLEASSLAELVTSSAEPVPRAPLRYPQTAREGELSAGYLDDVREMNRDVDRLTSIVTPRSSEFHLAVLRTESAAWQAEPKLGVRFRRAVRHALDQQRDQVSILSRAPRTLASTTGTVPVTIANDLEEHTVTVRLRVTPRNRARLEIGDYQEEVTVGPERKETVQVPMTARATGVTSVELQLATPNGDPYGDPVSLTVRATGYGTVALVITGGAFAVLFVAVGVRLIRRAIRAASGEDGTAPKTEGTADGGSHDDGADAKAGGIHADGKTGGRAAGIHADGKTGGKAGGKDTDESAGER